MSIFDELQTSLQEAVEIKQGKAQASRITRHEVADVEGIGNDSGQPCFFQRTCFTLTLYLQYECSVNI